MSVRERIASMSARVIRPAMASSVGGGAGRRRTPPCRPACRGWRRGGFGCWQGVTGVWQTVGHDRPRQHPATGSSAEPFDPARHLPDDLLARIHDRAAVVDRENRFVTDDLADLRRAGYLDILVPEPDGGVRFTGTKIFTTLSHAFTRLGVLGLDTTSPDAPRIVHAFLDGDDPGIHRDEHWDVLGMRCAYSRTTRLAGARARPERVLRRLPPGPSMDPYVFGIFASSELLLASEYLGLAERTLELGVAAAHSRRSKRTGQPLADDPAIRWRVAEAGLQLDGVRPQLAALACDVDRDAPHGARWFTLLSGAKMRATQVTRGVVEEMMHVCGGAAFDNRSEMARLYREVLAGLFHPSNDESAHATAATALLGPIGG
jgi:alkylation response protein AidB-like acyl-CoA dehydrogenase